MPHHYADKAPDGRLIHPPMTTPGPNALNVMTLGGMALAVGILEGSSVFRKNRKARD